MSFFVAPKYFRPVSIMLSFVPGASIITTLSIKSESTAQAHDVIPLMLQGIIGVFVGALLFAPAWSKLPIATEGEFIPFRFKDRFSKPLHVFRSLYLAWIIIPLIIASTLSFLNHETLFSEDRNAKLIGITFGLVFISTIFNSIKRRIQLDNIIGVISILFIVGYLFDAYSNPQPIQVQSFGTIDPSSIIFIGLISWWFNGLIDMPDMRAQKMLSVKKVKYPSLIIISPALLLFILNMLILFGPSSSIQENNFFSFFVVLNLWQFTGSMQHWSGNLVYENFYKKYISQKENKLLIYTSLFVPAIMAFIWSTFFQNTSSILLALFGLTAGVGPVYALRWFFWRVNALTQLVAMLGAVFLSIFKSSLFSISLIQSITMLFPFEKTYNELLIIGLFNCCLWIPTLFILNEEEKLQAKQQVRSIGLFKNFTSSNTLHQ